MKDMTQIAKDELQSLLEHGSPNEQADRIIRSVYNIAYSSGYRDGLANALRIMQEGKKS